MTKYLPGQSGNPIGKKKGTLNKRSQLAKLLEPYAEELIAKAVELAKSGDVNALRLCIERLIPKARSEVISLDMPPGSFTNTETLLALGAEVLKSVSNQSLTPEQGKVFIDIVEAQRKNIESGELSARVKEIETALKLRGKNEK